jgi:hypothetical protein
MGIHEIKKLLYNNRNGPSIKEAAHGMGENLCQLYTSDEELMIRIHWELKKLNSLKINDPMKKMSK